MDKIDLTERMRAARGAELARLRAAADAAEIAFENAARREYGPDGRWEFYRRDAQGLPLDAKVLEACNAYVAALHIYYQARDGERGFLGGRGL